MIHFYTPKNFLNTIKFTNRITAHLAKFCILLFLTTAITVKSYAQEDPPAKSPQTITAPAFSVVYGSDDFSTNATASSGLTVTYQSSDNSNVITIVNNKLRIIAAGEANVLITQPGNDLYDAAEAVLQTITVTKRPISIKPQPASTVYGAPIFSAGGPYYLTGAGLAPQDGMTGTFDINSSSREAGVYNSTLGTKRPVNASNGRDMSASYTITFIPEIYTITPKPVTVTPAPATKMYGDADPAFSYSSNGLINGNTLTGALSREPGEDAGNYAITTGTLANPNYTVDLVNTNFTIDPKPVTITAQPATKGYGDADPVFTYTYTAAELTGSNFTGQLGRAAGEDVGNYAINIGSLTLTNPNYTSTFLGADLTIEQKNIVVSANAHTKVYGDADPQLTYTYTGTLKSDDSFNGSLARQAGSTVGIYAINQGTLALSANYNLTFTGNDLTITKRPLKIAPIPATTVYGETLFARGAPYVISPTTLASTDGMTGNFGIDSESRNVGVYNITLGAKRPVNAGTGEDLSANYEITFETNTYTITPKPVTVTANPATKTYGDPEPEYTYTANGLIGTESLSGSISRTPGENIGEYALNRGTLDNTNYSISFTGNNLNITPKTINVSADAKSKAYGEADPQLIYTSDALVSGDAFTGELERATGETLGNYAISKGTLVLSNNYVLNYTANDLTIGKGQLTYVADTASRRYGTNNPAFTGTVTGFVFGETLATATTGTAVFQSAATTTSPVGNYPVNGSGLSAANYDFVQAPANATALTIIPTNDATLSAFSVTPGTFTSPFDPENLNYYLSSPHEVTSIGLSATANSIHGSLTVNGQAFTSGGTQSFPLIVGNNGFELIVTAQDGSTQTYSLNIWREPSGNNALTGISLSDVTFTPEFDNSILNYTANVPNSVTSTNVYGIAADSTANVTVYTHTATPAQPFNYPLMVGENVIPVTSTAANGAIRTFTVNVTRAKSPDATLSYIGINTTLNIPFNPAIHSYHTTVLNYTENITFLPVATNSWATITINGQPLNGFSGNFIWLGYGNNNVTIAVTSQDGANTINYVVNVIRPRSAEANLSNITIPNFAVLNETFDADVYDYTANVADSTITGLLVKIMRSNITGSVKVNNQAVADPENYIAQLHGGVNNFAIAVTSQDTSVTKTYNLAITRAGQAPPPQSADATLAALNVNNGSFSRNFNLAYDELVTVNAANNVSSAYINLFTRHSGATITVNGEPLTDPETFGPVDLVVGDNLFTILVTAENGVATQTYQLHVNRLPFVDVSLALLTIGKGTLSPAFNAATLNYTARVQSADSTIVITALATSATATVTIGLDTLTTANPSSTQALYQGLNNLSIRVTAADGVTNRIYRVRVTRPNAAENADLQAIELSEGAISPVFAAGVINYVVAVNEGISNIQVKPVAAEASATVTVNSLPAQPTADISLPPGDNVITVIVTSPNSLVTKTYTFTVVRKLSDNALLGGLELDQGIVKAKATGTNFRDYTATVANTITAVRITATAKEAAATITVNGIAVTSGVPSAPIALIAGANVINNEVTAQDGITKNIYSIVVTRKPSDNALLGSMLFNPTITTRKVSGTNFRDYEATVVNTVNSVRVSATPKDALATLRINGTVTAHGTASAPITLNVGANTVNVAVTAADGITTNVYSTVIIRLPSTDATLSGLNLNPNISKAKATGPNYRDYTAVVNNTTTALSVTALATHPGATISINGVPATSGMPLPVVLGAGATTINAIVTAEDGITTKTYSVVVTRQASANANLKSVTLSPGFAVSKVSATQYGAAVNTNTATIRVKPVLEDTTATVTINGLNRVVSYSPEISLTESANTIDIEVTAQNGQKRNYTLTITKPGVARQTAALNISYDKQEATLPEISVSKALSPNGDGINDWLIIDNIEQYADNKISVINASGNTVFMATGYDNRTNTFNGYSNTGHRLNGGTYFYLLEYNTGKETKRKTGYLVLKY